MLVALHCFVYLKIVTMLTFPQLYSHIFGATRHTLSVWMETEVVDHARVLPQSLLTLTCFVVPNFDSGIFTR